MSIIPAAVSLSLCFIHENCFSQLMINNMRHDGMTCVTYFLMSYANIYFWGSARVEIGSTTFATLSSISIVY